MRQYLPLVKSIVARMKIYFPPQAEIEDIYSVGVSGLITAIRRRDPRQEKSFSSFAMLRIRGAILDELRRMDWLPRANRMQAKMVRQSIEKLEQKLMRPAEEKEICEELGMEVNEYRRLLDQMRPISLISLDSPLNPGENDRSAVHEVLSDDTQLNARERCEKREIIRLMKERIQQLPDVPKKVLMMYYFEGMRLAEIAAVFNLTESRICQIHAQAVVSLRSYLERVSKK